MEKEDREKSGSQSDMVKRTKKKINTKNLFMLIRKQGKIFVFNIYMIRKKDSKNQSEVKDRYNLMWKKRTVKKRSQLHTLKRTKKR